MNELRPYHTSEEMTDLFLSASEDRSIRLWSLRAGGCIAVFGGPAGHRDQVLSVDWHPTGSRFVSGGVDNRVFIWELSFPLETSGFSRWFASDSEEGPIRVKQPLWSNSLWLRLHSFYIDCVRWLDQECIISKSVDSELVLWKPLINYPRGGRPFKILHSLKYREGSIWFVRFELFCKREGGGERWSKRVVWGNDTGSIWRCKVRRDDRGFERLKETLCPPNVAKLPVRCVVPIYFPEYPTSISYLSVGQDGYLRLWA